MSTRKEPWLAVTLSVFCAGLGLVYTNHLALFIFLFASVMITAFVGIISIASELGNTACGWAFVFYSLALYALGCYSSFRLTVKSNSIDFEGFRRRDKDLYVAFLLSTFVPGIGHLYLRRLEGILFLILYIVFLLYGEQTVPWIIYVIARALVSFSIFLKIPDPSRWTVRNGTFLSIGFLLLLTVMRICTYWLIPDYLLYSFPAGESMHPTIEDGDLILAKHINRTQLRRGDIICFRGNEKFDNRRIVKRLIGLSGDTVTIVNGRNVLVNSSAVDYSPYNNVHSEPGQLFSQSANAVVVPRHSLYVLGDNVLKSYDSRFAGGIPRSSVYGVVYKIVWPLQRIRTLRTDIR